MDWGDSDGLRAGLWRNPTSTPKGSVVPDAQFRPTTVSGCDDQYDIAFTILMYFFEISLCTSEVLPLVVYSIVRFLSIDEHTV